MNKDFDQFNNDFKALVESYEPSYSVDSWKRLESELPKSKGNFWYYFAASVFLLAIASFFIPFNNSDRNIDNKILKDNLGNISTNTNPKEETVIAEDVVDNSKVQLSVVEDKEEVIVPVLDDGEKISDAEKKQKPSQDNANVIDKKSIVSAEREVPVEVENILSDCDKTLKELPELTPVVKFDKTKGCLPLSVNAVLKGVSGLYKIKWILNGETISNSCILKKSFDKSGKHLVQLRVTGNDSKIYYSQDFNIEVFDLPKADYDIEEEDGILTIENQSKNYNDLTWYFSGVETHEENPTFEMLYSDTYLLKLKLTNSNSCVTEVSEEIVYRVNHHVFAPTAFSPDGDGTNDEFVVKYQKKEGYRYRLQVFNSAGKKLFESSEAQQSWKGDLNTLGKQTQNQKYIWRLIVEDPRGYTVIKEGVFFQL